MPVFEVSTDTPSNSIPANGRIPYGNLSTGQWDTVNPWAVVFAGLIQPTPASGAGDDMHWRGASAGSGNNDGASLIIQPGQASGTGTDGIIILRGAGGTVGEDEIQVSHDGTDGSISSQSGSLKLNAGAVVVSSLGSGVAFPVVTYSAQLAAAATLGTGTGYDVKAGVYGSVVADAGADGTEQMTGVAADVVIPPGVDRNIGYLYGVEAYARDRGTGDTLFVRGFSAYAESSGTGTTGEVSGLAVYAEGSAGTVTSLYGVYVQAPGAGGTITTAAGLNVESWAGVSSGFNIRSQGSTSKNAFEGSVLIGGLTSLNSAALLQADSTTKGFLPPRMTTTQRDAISSPPAGLTIYNTTTGALNVYTSSWGAVGGAVAGSDTYVQFNDGGILGGDAGLTYNKTTDTLTVVGDSISTGKLIARQSGGVAGTDEVQISHDGDYGYVESKSGMLRLRDSGATYELTVGNPFNRFAFFESSSEFFSVSITSGFRLRNDMAVTWSSTSAASGSLDTGLARSAAAVVKVTDGSTGLGSLVSDLLVARQDGGVAGTDEVQIYHDGSNAYFEVKDGAFRVRLSAFNPLSIDASTATFEVSLSCAALFPVANGIYDIGLNAVRWRNLLLSGYALCTVLVEANTAGSGSPNVLTATESRTVLTNEGSTAQNYHNLPSAAAGLQYDFIVQDSDGIRITAASGDTIRDVGTVSSTAGFIQSTTVGSTLRLVAINNTEWVVFCKQGTWGIDA